MQNSPRINSRLAGFEVLDALNSGIRDTIFISKTESYQYHYSEVRRLYLLFMTLLISWPDVSRDSGNLLDTV